MLTMLVRGLPSTTTQLALAEMFSAYGRVFDVRLVTDIFSGQCKGFGTLRMEGHEARAAMAALDGSSQGGSFIKVSVDDGRKRHRR
jgi:RNA recognition motif-containing protein